MNIMDNIYYLLGAPCSGKTTISKLLCEKYNILYYSGDEHRFDYYKNAQIKIHPWMTKDCKDFFGWTADEMIEWERGVIAEQTPMIIETLNELALTVDKILFEGMLDLSVAKNLVKPNRICYLTVDNEIAKRDFYNRESHEGLLNKIMNDSLITEDEKKRRLNMRRQVAINAFNIDSQIHNIKKYNRTNTSVKEMMEAIEKHFELER